MVCPSQFAKGATEKSTRPIQGRGNTARCDVQASVEAVKTIPPSRAEKCGNITRCTVGFATIGERPLNAKFAAGLKAENSNGRIGRAFTTRNGKIGGNFACHAIAPLTAKKMHTVQRENPGRLTCPACGSTSFVIKSRNHVQCRNCDHAIKTAGVAKYGNVRQTHDGYSYMSKLEARYAAELDLRLRAGDIKAWQRQVKLSLDVNGHHIANYYMDFVITHNDDSQEFVECKGAETDTWRMKWRLTEALFPNIKLTIIK